MNINYHYFVIKTLACAAGFAEDQAQAIAYYSQQVDDYTMYHPIFISAEPPEYFIVNNYAMKLSDKLWLMLPHPTGIDIPRSLEKSYRYTTLAPFHFIPGKPFSQINTEKNVSRSEYRCIPGCMDSASLMKGIIAQAVEAVKEKKDINTLMLLGMALHTYADTYAHCWFSGIEGWENKAVIKKVTNQSTGKEEIPRLERYIFQDLPRIGHCNAGTAPDICAAKIDLKILVEKYGRKWNRHIRRDNRKWFLQCAKDILDILCSCLCTDKWNKKAWANLSGRISKAMQLPASDEQKQEELIKKWGHYFPEIDYHYKKGQRFFIKGSTVLEEIEDGVIHHVTEEFFTYNLFAYQRSELVLGTSGYMQERTPYLTEAASKYEEGKKRKSASNIKPRLTTRQSGGKAGTDGSMELKMDTKGPGHWEPRTELGELVYAAGFEYCPQKDILCSTLHNFQRLAGYCRVYDECALSVFYAIDCEPIYFCYGGHEWMLELWKGQYGLETGCEAGIYYRKAGKHESAAEKITGKMYQCVPDSDMLEMSFTLQKDGNPLFNREWEKHWWLTGFRWGVYSEPEELRMDFGVRFPNIKMKEAFLTGGESRNRKVQKQGLLSLGYSYEEPDETSVQFCFSKPHTVQPGASPKTRAMIQEVNKRIVAEYNSICEKHNISCCDPDVIYRKLSSEKAGAAERLLYEKLVRYYKGKQKRREFHF